MKLYVFAILMGLTVALSNSQAHADEIDAFREQFLSGQTAWSQVAERAKTEGKVNLYYWGGNDLLNVWMDTTVRPAMQTEGIQLNAVRIPSTRDAIDLILAEIGAGRTLGTGSVDLIWLNGENFSTLKRRGALFGSFAPRLPNARYIEWNEKDPRSLLNLRDFGVETDGAEVPWSAEQFVCAVNTDRVPRGDIPHTFDGLHRYLKANPGKFTYVKPPHYLGNTFVQEAIYAHNPDGTGALAFQDPIEAIGPAELSRLISPGLRFLQEIEPLLHGGSPDTSPRYPEDPSALDGMFLNGEVDFNCKFGMYAVATGLNTGSYPSGAEQFIFPKTYMIRNKNYLGIPANASHPAAALVLANYMTSVAAQISKQKHTGMPAGIDPWKLSESEASALRDAAPGLLGVTQAELDANVAADTNATLVDVIEATWLEVIERDNPAPIVEIVTEIYAKFGQ